MKILSSKNKNKVFCVGLNKTGTTTVETVFRDFNYQLGEQSKAELLANHWYNRDFRKIIDFSKTAQAFQDIPFSLPFTYLFLDQYFENSKFILTVRDDSDQWYNSITRFHSKLWANDKGLPTVEDLKKAQYRYEGYAYEINRYMFNSTEEEPYNKDILVKYYNNHMYSVIEYFRSKPEKLLVINVSEHNDYFRLCKFLNKKPLHNGFPWENRTDKI